MHAVRNLVRIGFGTTAVRWSQLGFGRTSSTSTSQATPRNLFGFKDGTRNLKAEDTDLLREHVWVQPGDGPAWMTGGSYLVARRIRMHIETWDRTSLAEQESIIGRNKGDGAPARRRRRSSTSRTSRRRDGHPRSRRAHPAGSGAEPRTGCGSCGAATTSSTAATGWATSTRACSSWPTSATRSTQFVPMQRALAGKDRLKEYIEHTGSAVYAIPRGLGPQDYWGQALSPERLSGLPVAFPGFRVEGVRVGALGRGGLLGGAHVVGECRRRAARSSASGSTPASLAAAASANSCSPTPGAGGQQLGRQARAGGAADELGRQRDRGLAERRRRPHWTLRCFSSRFSSSQRCSWRSRGVHALGAREHVRVPSDELRDQVAARRRRS